jgi:RimJ/RimL family protein N-acetyltransferase
VPFCKDAYYPGAFARAQTENAVPVRTDLELADDSLLARPWLPGDAPALCEAVRESVASIGPWLPWCHAGYDLADAQDWIGHCRDGWAADEHFAFAVVDRATGVLLGSVGLNQRNRLHRSASMGYWVRQSRQHQGIAPRAVRLVARFGFDALELARIEIVALPGNRASRQVAQKAGARFEAVARHRLWMQGEPRDAAVYALIPADLAER